MGKLTFRFRYWVRQFWLALGLCHRCKTSLNFTRHGKGICPQCGR
jgi:predicted amidophosphoribosyltransferase